MAEYIVEARISKDANGSAAVSGMINPALWDERLEKITRCRDCKHCQPCDEGFFVCMRGWVVAVNDSGWEHELRVEVDPNGFCAWAERDA